MNIYIYMYMYMYPRVRGVMLESCAEQASFADTSGEDATYK